MFLRCWSNVNVRIYKWLIIIIIIIIIIIKKVLRNLCQMKQSSDQDLQDPLRNQEPSKQTRNF